MRHVRAIALALTTFLLAVGPALAAKPVDPGRLALRQADLPARFEADRDDTGVRTNEMEAKSNPTFRSKIVEWGRVTGYEAQWDRDSSFVSSRIDLYRSAFGSIRQLSYSDAELRKGGIKGLRRTRLALGDGGWLYDSPTPGIFVVAIWRHGRVFSGVAATGLTRTQAVALARVQERRIASELRESTR